MHMRGGSNLVSQAVIVRAKEKDPGFAGICAKFEKFGPLIVYPPAADGEPVCAFEEAVSCESRAD